ncbi:retention module-containing protein [Shewanella chilikensis]|uniref:retention module-containing protein n=1 Tax=Shewanella chilikensis TaxID=558541 RepID=UPI002DD41D25|nr:retention module-containing protein [Shewanella chilikensis]
MGVAISKQDAVDTNLVGQLKAKDENGNIRDLSIGDVIRNGEEIIFTANDTFTIEYADGTRLTEQNAQPSTQPQPDASAADVAQFANEGVDAEIAALQAQILAGDDPTANLPATAAGAGTAGNQGGFDYISVARDGSEVLASAGYDTSGFEQTAITTQEEILLEDIPLVGPTLDSSTATLSDANLPTGTTPSSTALTQAGNLSFSAAAGVASLTLDGIAIVSDGVFDGPINISTEYGVLTISAVDLINGNISYSFTLNSAVDHSSSDDFSQAFNLILTDLEGNSVGNTLTISVLDDAPSGQDDINSVDEDSLLAISGNLLDNDVQGADTAQVTAAGSGGNLDNAISNQSQVSGSYGLLTLNADGSYSYQINSAAQAVQALAQGESLTETFSYLLTDADGDTSIQTLTITITGTNDIPVISTPQPGEADGAVREAGQFDDGSIDPGTPGVSGQLSASDVDNGAVLIWSGSADSPLGSFSIDTATGAWNYQLDNAAADGLLEGEIRTETFSVTVTDEYGASAEQLVTITIIGTNDAPVLSADSSGSLTEDLDAIDGMLSDNGALSFTDVDINDSHSVSSSYNGDASWSGGDLGQATQDALAQGFSADNSGWSYDIANSLVQFLAVGETITLSFTLTVTDAFGASDSQSVTVTLTGTNDAPVLTIDMSGAVTEDVDVINGMLSDSGDLSFTDVDINDSHSVGSSYNGDILWSGGALDQATQDALAAGFSVDNAGWSYEIANSLVQFLAVGETITLSFDVTVDDGNGGTDTETVTITINGTNDPVEGEFAKEIWVPASLLQLSDPYLAGYPLNIDVPSDVDATDEISITNLSLEFIDPAETAEIGSIWYWDDGEQMLVQYDFDNPEALSATELGSLVYMPGNNGDIEEQLDISLTFTVNSGTDQVDGDFIIHAVPGNSLGGESVTIGDGSSPLTSGNDQDAVLNISSGFADAINLAPANGSLDLFTDYQKSPFAIPIPEDERDIGTPAGSKRETEVSVRLTINGVTFIVLLADPVDSVEQTWFYDADSGLMKASISYDQIVQELDNSITLADYLTLNPAQAGDLWTITYFDNEGGSYQARYVQAVFTHELLPDDAITITGSDDIDNLIFGSTQGDSLTGANQNDEIVGREGNDTIKGMEGDDQLLGGAGNDYIFAGTGADYLVGGPGSDHLDAGLDNDRDILIWDAGSADGSTDEVYNFAPNTDSLDLSDILVNEENGVLDDYLDFSFVNGNTIISVDTTGAGGDSVTIVLNGVDLSTEYGTTDEGMIIQSLISDGALLVTQPVVQASLPEPNYTYLSEEQLAP